MDSGTFSPPFSPQFRPASRPGSRQHYNGQPHDDSYISPDDNDDTFMHSISSLPMPRHDSDGEDSDNEDLIMERNIATSTASLEPGERVEALQRTNADLRKKLAEVENTMQNRLADHDAEIEDMQIRLDELKSELSATKREEKELRSKEVCVSAELES